MVQIAPQAVTTQLCECVCVCESGQCVGVDVMACPWQLFETTELFCGLCS